MAVGTTTVKVTSRNELVRNALRKVRAVKRGEQPDQNMMVEGVNALNQILREEDNDLTGSKTPLMALQTAHLFLTAGMYVYNAASGLPEDIHELASVSYRDLSGNDCPVKILTPAGYESIQVKKDTGDVQCVYLQLDQNKALQWLFVWPAPTSTGTVSIVSGTEGMTYRCLLGHTSSTGTRPITGSSYRLFWEAGGSSPSTWTTDTAYSSGALLRLLYKRPLYDFTAVDSDPDLPLGWSNYLMWRLAATLAPEYDIDLEERNWFLGQARDAKSLIFPSTVAKTTDFHNKGTYF